MSHKNDFLSNPIEFLKMYALLPPAGKPGEIIKAWEVQHAGNIASGGNNGNSSTISLKKAGASRVYAEFVNGGPGALAVNTAADSKNPEAFEQFWLPWESLAITKNHIPAMPAVGGANFPIAFMTAGINGCSIFVDGPANSPTVYHAGIEGNLARPADEFWKEQLGIAVGARRAQTPGQVHRDQYMRDSPNVQRYLAWLNGNNVGPFQIELTSNFGAVVGIRTNRDWRFYLQKNVMIQDVQVVKRSQVKSQILNKDVGKQYNMKGTNAPVTRTVTTQHRTFLPDKQIKTYTQRINARSACVKVVQIFPTRDLVGDWKPLEVRSVS
jgi:hypothetical protein